MQVWKTINAAREAIRIGGASLRPLALVPTMGALHEGHLALVREARSRCAAVIVSVFVNPTQFSPGEDFSRYPRPFERDCELLEGESVFAVFAPDPGEIYDADAATIVRVAGLTDHLCGPFRPGHFDGVATIVTKLFNILSPDAAFFGEKDFQQLQVVRRVVRDLNLPIEIIPCPTVRDADGVALSSRNAYLTPPQRVQARSLSAALFSAKDRITRGESDVSALISDMRQKILDAGPAEIEYIEIVDPDTLKPVSRADRPVRIALAVRIGACRLIDNVPAP
ncbi:MAG: pantoate--beta-alanine ligase [Phycisphaerae bacterium]|nr:MAG: pantoate--beta-alanine ligase [Planctomycetota bacterium]KAB2946857.1 MAG: pantoate--beta-alanine ligase [Phycisphaerae bacterium]MBE7457050.1 pantoate--beta-alanine ligase [Planctomycetia bacterium]MCK6463592.1 pantoate--beta-alanine ligase [Phycisphaerae bacterium]MCL4718260.1 pantoate--beta-alanine ligase [Phycisphaerae bacterium]